MSLTPWLPLVRKIKDGEPVDQGTVNVPIDQLTQRDQHLYEKFDELSGKSVLISFNQPIHPAETLSEQELSIVYFKNNYQGVGLAKGTTGFSASKSSSMYNPNNSNYSFGLLKTIYHEKHTADVFTEGLCELPINIDDPVHGLLQRDRSGTVEPFAIGPYFLSTKDPGKITNEPSGIPVYVGFAISKRKFLLHTNVDEFSQFFVNYRFHVLDRVAGVATISNDTWSIVDSDVNKLGWVSVDVLNDTPRPEGALFYYNIPGYSQLIDDTAGTYDASLASSEREEAYELRKYLPPVPANFIQLYVNGVLARYNNEYDTEGVFSVNEYGLWWHTNEDGFQPWSSNYPVETDPQYWIDIKDAVASSRKRVFISFSKFNPALRTQLVSSLVPYDRPATINTPKATPSNFIKFYGKDNPSETSPTGDLLVDIDAKINVKGYSDNAAFVYPTLVDNTYTSNRALAALKYSKEDGEFKAALTPVIAKLLEGGGVSLTEQPANSGIWKITAAQGLSGPVDSIEPINARLEFRELMSYIKLPPPSTTPYGIIGKIVLPKGYSNRRAIRLVFHVFGDVGFLAGATNRAVALQFQYSAVSATNGATPTVYNFVDTAKYAPTVNPVEVPMLLTGAYTAYSSVKLTHADLVVPAEFISDDCVVNFKILRVSTSSNNNSYAGNVGIIATYWEVV